MKCAICSNSETRRFLPLGNQPPSDAFLKKNDLEKNEATYPLELEYCPSCTLVQLTYAVDPDILFRDYVYTSGTNVRLQESFRNLVNSIVTNYSLTKNDFVIDVGSNDGTLLRNYLPHGVKILGVDPSSVAMNAAKNGIPTIVDYFNEATARKILNEYGTAKIITATNVFAHVLQLDSLMKGIDLLLEKGGVFITESGYMLDIIENMEYDCIYHEHLRYYSVLSLRALFDHYNMEVTSVERTRGSSGGSIRVYAARRGAYPIHPSVEALIAEEKMKGLDRFETYRAFGRKVESTKNELLDLLRELKNKKMRLAGVGAPAKGNTLLNYCQIGPDKLPYLAETSPLKIGLYSPGMHIPVVAESQLIEDQPDAALLLSWNYADVIIPKLRKLGYRGKFIIPNPSPHII